jgi:hypothetical protein
MHCACLLNEQKSNSNTPDPKQRLWLTPTSHMIQSRGTLLFAHPAGIERPIELPARLDAGWV